MEPRCYFADRCPKAMEDCLNKPPEFSVDGSDQHAVKCVLAEREYDARHALPEDHFGPTDVAALADDRDVADDGEVADDD
jgi:peptide/nickel transport system ATP-binding protein